MVPPLYILRHGETEWNAAGRLQGSHDSALTAAGRAQARAQHAILSERDLTGFAGISSPQGRALDTARIALEGLVPGVATENALREIGIGAWAGRNRAELIAEHGAVDGFALYEMAPDGEGFAALRQRCTQFLNRLESPGILITHGITSRMLRLILTGQGTEALRDMAGGQGVVFYLADGVQHRLTTGA